MKIFISGASGSGKSTLAEYIASRYRIPFITSSGKILWKEYGISSHSDLIKRTATEPKFGLEYQQRLLDYRRVLIEENEEFVTDRSPLDNIVYFMLQVAHYLTGAETADYIQACIQSYPQESFLQFILSVNHKGVVEDDNMRITNPMYQLMVEGMIGYLLQTDWVQFEKNNFAYVSSINVWNWEDRINIVDKTVRQHARKLK